MTPSRVGIDIANRRRNWREQKRRQRASVTRVQCRAVVDSRRCLRNASINGRCYQHATDHDRIVQRILSIPVRV